MKNLSKIWPLGICAGLLFAVTRWVDAESAHPIKNLKEANRLIHWPKGFTPEEGDAFVHNEIWINAPAKVIWTNLINATVSLRFPGNCKKGTQMPSEILNSDSWILYSF